MVDLDDDGEISDSEVNDSDNNSFVLELSDNNGNFNNPTVIATINNFFTPLINAKLPNNLIAGDNYRLRVRATHGLDYIQNTTNQVISNETLPFEVVTGSV